MNLALATLSGTVSRDAEQRFTPNNNAVISFNINISRYDGRSKSEKSYPVKINFWSDSPDLVSKLRKGTRVLVNGRLQLEQYTDKNNKVVRVAVVEANKINLIEDMLSSSNAFEEIGDMDSGLEMLGSNSSAELEEIPF